MSNALIYSSDLPDLCVLASVTSRLLLLTCIFHCCRSNHDDLEGRWIQKRERESQTKGCSLKVWVDIYTFDQLIVEILHLLKWRLWAEQSSEVGVNAEPAFSAALDLDWKHRLGCFAVYILWIEITCFVKPVHDNGCQTRGKGGEPREGKEEWLSKTEKTKRGCLKEASLVFNESKMRPVRSETAYFQPAFWFGSSLEAKTQHRLVLVCARLPAWGFWGQLQSLGWEAGFQAELWHDVC